MLKTKFICQKYFRASKKNQNPKLRSILEFPVLFLGAKPNKTPFLQFYESCRFRVGNLVSERWFQCSCTWNGKLAKELGVEFHVNEEVIGIDYENNQAKNQNSKRSV